MLGAGETHQIRKCCKYLNLTSINVGINEVNLSNSGFRRIKLKESKILEAIFSSSATFDTE
jgi:hypothetical protein